MKPQFNDQDDLRMTEQAASWLTALKEAKDEDQVAFGEWLKASPRHVEEFLFVAAAERAFDDLQQRSAPMDLELMVAHSWKNVVPLDALTSPLPAAPQDEAQEPKNKPWMWLAAAVIAVAVTAGGWASATYPRWYGYSTALGEQRAFELEDGSIIHLNTQSRVKVNITSKRRELQMVKGEAMFRVARDVQRPFRVHVGQSTIQAVGTQFNVYRSSPDDTTVSVIEGLVRISQEVNVPPHDDFRTGASAPGPGSVPPSGSKRIEVKPGMDAGMDRGAASDLFAAGEGANIAAATGITRHEAVDIVKVSAWRQRRLVFRGDRLEDVAGEFNRYNQTPRIRVEGALAANKQMAGVFDADDPESLLLFLSQYGDLTSERIGDRLVVIRGRDDVAQ